MKNLLIITLFLLSSFLYSQESLIKFYKIPNYVVYPESKYDSSKGYVNDTVFLVRDVEIKYSKLHKLQSDKLRDKLKKKIETNFPIGTDLDYSFEKNVTGKKSIVFKYVLIDSSFWNDQTETFQKKFQNIGLGLDSTIYNAKELPPKHFAKKKLFIFRKKTHAQIIFDDKDKSKLLINPYLRRNGNKEYERDLYYFKLKNRRSIELNYFETSFSALTIPIKYRFRNNRKGDARDVKEEFSSKINAGVTYNIGFGRSKFIYREKTENKTFSWKLSTGPFINVSTVDLDSKNTSASTKPFGEDIKETRALLSYGLGFYYSFNKFNIGGFVGIDNAIGEGAQKWNYQGEPWVGFGIGFSIFNF